MVALIKCEHGAYGYGFVCEKCKKSWEAHIRQEERDAIVEVVEGMKKEAEKFVPFQKIHYVSALNDILSKLQTSNKTV